MTRRLFERVCRLAALMALATALWASVRAVAGAPDVPARTVLVLSDSAATDTGARAVAPLRRLVRGGSIDTAVLPLRALPSPTVRAALGALGASGVPVRWFDSTRARGLAASVVRSATPDAPLSVRASVVAGTPVVLRDAGGVLDSLSANNPVATWELRSATAPLAVQQQLSRAVLATRDSLPAQRVLVLAQPGWEGKFVVAALEEAGWPVDGRMTVSPSGSVTIGTPQRLELSRYAAVVVLDSMSLDAGALSGFVLRGGGLVLGGDALRIPALSALRPARATTVRGAVAGALLTGEPRRGLDAWELETVTDAVVLQSDASDHGHGEPALVAVRRARGRVVAMPYRETWRWRMQGTDDGMTDHRRWWQSALLAAVPGMGTAAKADSANAHTDPLPGAAAPYADLVARIGAPASAAATVATAGASAAAGDERGSSRQFPRVPTTHFLLGITVVALLAEWTSRRLRGVR